MSFSQLRVDLGIADHVWQEKHDDIAKTVNSLGDEFKSLQCALVGWRTSARPIQMGRQLLAAAVDAIGEGTLVLDDD
jgi:hypothetical protein